MLTARRLGFPLLAPLLLAPALVGLPRPGWAQIEEITVTARRREESLQDVPIAVEVVTSEVLERKGLRDIADILQQSASLNFDQGAVSSDTRITVRGLSPSRGRQNVAILVDGIDVSSESISSSGGSILVNQRLIDIERVEILKGPQIALYGRSAFNGVIQYVTKDPSDQFTTELSADANAENQYSMTAAFSGPIFGEKLGYRVNAAYWDEPGYYTNSITGEEIGGDEGYGLSLTTKSLFGERFSIKARAEFTHSESQPAAEAFIPFNSVLPIADSAFEGDVDAENPEDLPVFFCLPEQIAAESNPDLFGDVFLNEALQARYARLSRDPANPVPGDGPHCQRSVPYATGRVPDKDELTVALSTNPLGSPGEDFEGVDHDTLRLSLTAEWDVGPGTLTSWTGYTHDDSTESLDQGKYAFLATPGTYGRIDPTPFLDANTSTFLFDNDKETQQFSQELRYATNLDGPVNATFGGVWWQEEVDNASRGNPIQAASSYCFYTLQGGPFEEFFGFPGCEGFTELPVLPFLAGGFDFGDGTPYNGISEFRRPSPADRDTDHWSVYGELDIRLSSTVSLILEGRYSHEDIEVFGPVFLDPGATGGPGGFSVCGVPLTPCDEAFLFGPTGPFASQAAFEAFYDKWDPLALFDDDNPSLGTYADNIRAPCDKDPATLARVAEAEAAGEDPYFDLFNPYCVSSEKRTDKWFSPKITLNWQPTDNLLLYTYWAHAEKPGGFSTLTIGSSGLNRSLSEFDPEKMDVYEVGGNASLLDQTLRLSGAVFFNDFTDKQFLRQALGADGRPVSFIANAQGTELWGAEIEALWQPVSPFLGGNWTLRGAYTYIDGEYTDLTDNATSENNVATAGNCEKSFIEVNTGIDGDDPDDEPDIVRRASCKISWSGNTLEDAPEHAFTGTVAYARPFTQAVDFFVAADVQWTDDRFIEFSNESYVDAYWNTDLQLGFQGERWEILGYVTNLFDDDTVRSASSGPGLSCCFTLGVAVDLSGQAFGGSTAEVPIPKAAFLPPPRVVGMRFRWRFGGDL